MGQILSLGDFLSMLKRRFWLMALVVLLGTSAAVFYALGQKKIYAATAVAQIEAPVVTDTSNGRAGAGTSIDRRLRLLEQQLMARDNLLAVIKKYGLYSDTDLSDNLKVSTLRTAARLVQITDPNAAWGAQRIPTGMMITVHDADPEMAALLANNFLQSLLELNNKRQSEAASEQLAFFQAEKARVNEEITQLETRIAEFKERNANFLPAGIGAQRTELAQLRNTLLELDQSLIELEANTGRQRASVVERQRALITERQDLIRGRITEIEEAITAAPEVERQLSTLEREHEQLNEQFTVITQRATSAEMSQALESQNQFERIEVLETALVPESPISGSRKRLVILGFLASGLLALGLAFLLEVLRPVLRTREHLERQFEVKAVVAIPRIQTKRDLRRKKVLRYAALVFLVALVPLIYGFLRDGFGGIINVLQRVLPLRSQ